MLKKHNEEAVREKIRRLKKEEEARKKAKFIHESQQRRQIEVEIQRKAIADKKEAKAREVLNKRDARLRKAEKIWTNVYRDGTALAEEYRTTVQADKVQAEVEGRATDAKNVEAYYHKKGLKGEKETVVSSSTASGILGVPLAQGEYFSRLGGGFNPDFDIPDSKLFSPVQSSDAELKRIELQDLQSKEGRLMERVSEIDSLLETMKDDRQNMVEALAKTQEDILFIQCDCDAKERDLIGPPRRDPRPGEIEGIASLKQRILGLQRRKTNLTADIQSLRVERKRLLAEQGSIMSELGDLKDTVDDVQLVVDGLGPEGDLPMIVGRNVGAVPGLGPQLENRLNPDWEREKLQLESKLHIVQPAIRALEFVEKDLKNADHSLWKLRQQERDMELELERNVSRAAAIKAQLEERGLGELRRNLIQALHAFFKSPDKLRTAQGYSSGIVKWWDLRDPSRCENVEPYGKELNVHSFGSEGSGAFSQNSALFEGDADEARRQRESRIHRLANASVCMQGIRLGGGKKSGSAEGTLLFPAHSIWEVDFIITKADELDFSTNEADFINFKYGASTHSLSSFGRFHNRRVKGFSGVFHVLTTKILGRSVTFRFEFLATSSLLKDHLCVLAGVFRQYNPPPLQLVDVKRRIWVSDKVLKMREERRQGQMRAYSLLEEILKVKESKTSWFDTRLVHGHHQRFKREHLLKALQLELQGELGKLEEMRVADEKQFGFDASSLAITEELSKEQKHAVKIRDAIGRYFSRKQAGNTRSLDAAKELIGKRLEAYDPVKGTWRVGLIEEMKSFSVDGGFQLKILHRINYSDPDKSSSVRKATSTSSDAVDDVLLEGESSDVWENLSMLRHNILENAVVRAGLVAIDELWQLDPLIVDRRRKIAGADALIELGVATRRPNGFLALPIANFSKVVLGATRCEHTRTRHWGTKYGRGIRCADCGEELLQDSQSKTTVKGPPDAPKFADSAAAALARAKEREHAIRMGKEAAVLKNHEDWFYDHPFPKKLLDFNSRHQIVDLTADAGGAESAPTGRRRELYHRAGFREHLSLFCRTHQFEMRIREALAQEKLFNDIRLVSSLKLGELHNTGKQMESRISVINCEWAKADKLLEIRREAVQSEKMCRRKYIRAKKGLKVRLKAACAMEARAVECETDASEIGSILIEMLKWRQRTDIAHMHCEKLKNEALTRAKEARDSLTVVRNDVARIGSFQVGSNVDTPFGRAEIVDYREKDDILRLRLRWKNQPTMLMLFMSRVSMTRAQGCREQEESLKMYCEEKSTRRIWAYDAAQIKKESLLMAQEEAHTRECLAWAEEQKKEAQEIERDTKQAKSDAAFRLKDDVMEFRFREAGMDAVMKAVLARLKLRKSRQSSVDPNLRKKVPEKLTKWEKLEIRMSEEKRLREEFVEEQVTLGIQAARDAVVRRRDTAMIEKLILLTETLILDHMLPEIASEALQNSLADRQRCEVESELPFAVMPPDMAYHGFKPLADVLDDSSTVVATPRKPKGLTRAALLKVFAGMGSSAGYSMAWGLGKHVYHHIWFKIALLWRQRRRDLGNAIYRLGGHEMDLHEEKRLHQQERLQRAKLEWVRSGRTMNYFSLAKQERLWKEEQELLAREERVAEKTKRDMLLDETYVRKVYRIERRRCLKERWGMDAEENFMRDFLRKEKILNMKSKYDVLGDKPKVVTVKQTRREALKKSMAERQRQRIEFRLMHEEDVLAMQVRVEWLRKLAKRRMRAQMGYDLASETEEEEDDDGAPSDSSAMSDSSEEEEHHKSVRLNDLGLPWYDTILASNSRQPVAQNILKKLGELAVVPAKELPKKAHKRRKKIRTIKRKIRRQRRRERVMSGRAQMSVLKACKSELKLLLSQEEVRRAEYGLRLAEANASKIRARSLAKQSVEKRVKAEAVRRRNMADKATLAANVAQAKVDRRKPRLHRAISEKQRILEETEYMDSDVIHHQTQRYRTKELHFQLHWHWFRSIVERVAVHAETVANERRTLLSNLKVQQAREVQVSKTKALQHLTHKRLQYERLRMKRSTLGRQMFSKWQLAIKSAAFKGWREFAVWRGGIKRNYNLRFEAIRQAKEVKDMQMKAIEVLKKKQQPHAGKSRPLLTFLQRHNARPIFCRNCRQQYTPAGNYASACSFHPGVYEMRCPRSCEKFTTSCMTHFKIRWSCCDRTDPSPFGKDGCESRWHMPPPKDEEYDDRYMKLKHESDAKRALMKQRQDLVAQAKNNARLGEIEELKKVAKFHDEEVGYVDKFERMKPA